MAGDTESLRQRPTGFRAAWQKSPPLAPLARAAAIVTVKRRRITVLCSSCSPCTLEVTWRTCVSLSELSVPVITSIITSIQLWYSDTM